MSYIALTIAAINQENLFMLPFGLTSQARPYEVLSFLLRLLFNMKGKPLGPTLKQRIFSFYNRKVNNLHWVVEPWSDCWQARISQECLHIR